MTSVLIFFLVLLHFTKQSSAYLQYNPGSFVWMLEEKAMQKYIYAFTRSTFVTVVVFFQVSFFLVLLYSYCLCERHTAIACSGKYP